MITKDELVAARHRLGYSQAMMAGLLGVVRATYIAREMNPGSMTLAQYAAICDILSLESHIDTPQPPRPRLEVCPRCRGLGKVLAGSLDADIPVTREPGDAAA